MELKQWAELIYIDPNIPLRNPPSKHQERILDIIFLVKKARVEPSKMVHDSLLELKDIGCYGDSEHVGYCRYLQHAVSILKDEGSTESIKGE